MKAMIQNETEKPVCWFLGQPYTSGCVEAYLSKQDYNYILGIDIGHGESTAYAYWKNEKGEWELRRMTLNENGSVVVPSYICYTGKKILYGQDAGSRVDYIAHFKEIPEKWHEKPDGEHSYGQMMEDFIRLFWESICRYDTGTLMSAKRAGTLLVAVGCPASKQWTSSKSLALYRKRIISAIGYSNVAILPESTAAMMVAVRRKNINLSNGVAVYDLGSSTIDFTYLLAGKKRISMSLRLAGADIDKAMLRKVLRDNNLTLEHISDLQMPQILTQIRNEKEAFYRRGPGPEQLLLLKKEDDQGNLISCNLRECPIFQITEEFMEEVLTKDLDVSEDVGKENPVYANKSWYQCVETFVKDSQGMIQKEPCSTVILTGGTSFVTQVTQIAKKNCRGSVLRENDPSASVAMGLAYAKGRESKACVNLEEKKAKLRENCEPNFEKMTEDLAKSTFDIAWESTKEALSELAKTGKRQSLNQISTAIKDQTEKETARVMHSKQQMLIRDCCIENQPKVIAASNQISEEVYDAKISSVPQLATVNTSRIDTSDIYFDGLIKHHTGVLKLEFALISVYLVLLAALWIIAIFGGQLWMIPVLRTIKRKDIAKDFSKIEKMLSRVTIPAQKCEKIANDLDKPKKKESEWENCKKELIDHLRDNQELRDAVNKITQDQFEIGLGKVLFLVFDEGDMEV